MMAPLLLKSNSKMIALRTLFLSKEEAVQLRKEVDRATRLLEYHPVSSHQAWKVWQHKRCRTQPCVLKSNGTLEVVPHNRLHPNPNSVKSAKSLRCRSSKESCTITLEL